MSPGKEDKRPLRVGVNAHLLSGQQGYRRAGIHHYIAQALRHLPAEAGIEYTIFTGSPLAIAERSDFTVVGPPWPTRHPVGRILWEQTIWPLEMKRRQLHLSHSMAFVTPLWSPAPAIVTIYDLSFIHYPERFPSWQRRYLTGQTRRSCQQAKRIIAISEAGRQDIHRHFDAPLERIDVVHPGVDDHFRPLEQKEIDAFRRAQELPDSFLLHVGTLQPRKNIPLLIEALAQLEEDETALVLVGGKGWLYDDIFARVRRLDLEKRVRFAGYVADAELPLWYNAAAALVFPSVYEGFGLPVVQAMACGTPVIAANTSSIPEAAGDAALLFASDDITALVNHMSTVINNSEIRAKLGQQGIEQARRFSWAQSGRKMAGIYAHLDR